MALALCYLFGDVLFVVRFLSSLTFYLLNLLCAIFGTSYVYFASTAFLF